MKTLSNTSIAAIFAVGLTLLVVLLLKVPYFADKETQTQDEMMLLRYHLHNKYFPLKPDPKLIIAAIDQKSLDLIGRWPFNRSVHGDFLLLLAPEQPRAVGWDILLTERENLPNSPTAAPQASANASPTATAPAPTTPPAITPAPTDATPATPPQTTAPATVPDAAPAAPANPPPANTNAAPSTATPVPATGSTVIVPISDSIVFGADLPASGTAPSPVTTLPAPAAASPAGTPASDTPNPTPTPTAPAAAPATDAPNTNPASALPPASPYLTSSDQHLVDAASLYPNMVMAAELSSEIQTMLPIDNNGHGTDSDESDQGLLPTRAFKNVTGDITKILSAPHANLPFPELRKETYFGFVNENGENGGGSRRTDPLVVNMGGKILPNLDLQLLLQYWGVDPDKVSIDLGHNITIQKPDGTQVRIPIDEKGQLALNYRARLENFQYMSYAQMASGLQAKAAGTQSEDRNHLLPLKDALVVIGVTFSGTDAGVTPLDNQAPLVVTHLNAINNMLQGDYLKQVSPWIWMPVYALFLFGTGSLMLRVGIAPMIPIGVLALIVLGLVAFGLLWFNYLVPIGTPEIGILLLAGAVPTKRFFGEEREKLRVKSAMRAHLSDKVMNKILTDPDGAKLGGTKEVITVMFCDIRGFTAYCDNRDPQEVLTVVNEYFEEMTKVVFKYDGTIDKFIGDCIMAFWNQPQLQPDHAQRAVCCAMEMRYALANFKVRRAGLDTELFECGIGIHTGEALVGNMGSSHKISYTAMGSTVNLGARLEALTKKLNERILISKDTYEQLTGDFPITDRGEAVIPGFANPIHVYGVGAEQDLSSAIMVGLKLAKKQEYTAEEVTKPIWAPAPLPEDADPNP